jgi:outer membrane lipoprotein carrier protein
MRQCGAPNFIVGEDEDLLRRGQFGTARIVSYQRLREIGAHRGPDLPVPDAGCTPILNLHVPRPPCVNPFVSPLRLLLCLLPVSLAAQTVDLAPVLKAVEARYNRAETLQVSFREAYTGPGQPRRTESGTLLLRKPGRMRWDYTSPEGKLFVSDGKFLWLYTPSNHQVEKMKIKESDDMRAPLAFLLGKLHFDKEFRNIQHNSVAGGIRITADPKTDTLPYTKVEFVVAPDSIIRRVQVTGYDQSILEFDFDQEKLNPPLEAKLFQFRMPPGAELVESAQ